MATLGTMKTRIADELARTDLTTQIAAAISSAIETYDRKRTIWNETTGTFTTASGTEYYSSSNFSPLNNGITEIDGMFITIGTSRYQLTKRTMDEIEGWAQGTSAAGDPTDYCWYKQNFRLWPVPNATRTITVAYVAKLGTPASDGASNAWTTEAEQLIRTVAKIDLMENVIRGDAELGEADRLRRRAQELWRDMVVEMNRLKSSGRIVASYI